MPKSVWLECLCLWVCGRQLELKLKRRRTKLKCNQVHAGCVPRHAACGACACRLLLPSALGPSPPPVPAVYTRYTVCSSPSTSAAAAASSAAALAAAAAAAASIHPTVYLPVSVSIICLPPRARVLACSRARAACAAGAPTTKVYGVVLPG